MRKGGHADHELLGGARPGGAIDLLAQVVVEAGEREGLRCVAPADRGRHRRIAAPWADGSRVLGQLQREDDEAMSRHGLDGATVDDGLIRLGHFSHLPFEVLPAQAAIGRPHRGATRRLCSAGQPTREQDHA